MGLPNINIAFKKRAEDFTGDSRGIVALILKDNAIQSPFTVITDKGIPENLQEDNKEQIKLALIGALDNSPKVLVVGIKEDAQDYTSALNYLETSKFSYLAIPFIEHDDSLKVAEWVKNTRKNIKRVKVVLPKTEAECEGVINFTTDEIMVKEKKYTATQYCSRIAGILAATSLTMSVTYMSLLEVDDVTRLTKDEADKAIDSGQLILINDGEKCKIARGVNSLTKLSKDQKDDFKKILIVAKKDKWYEDIKHVIGDSYLGKYCNTYDNKILLIAAITVYNNQLALQGLLDNSNPDYNSVGIDIEAQKAYLKSKGKNVDDMKIKDILKANTADKVFIYSSLKWTDAMEDFDINVNM